MYSNWYIFAYYVGWHLSSDIIRKNIPIAVHTVPPDDEQKSAGNM
jgi:hypothetical protein